MIRIGGLIDGHVHLAAGDAAIGVDPAHLRRIGVVAAVDAGTYGADDFESAARTWRAGALPVRVFVNASPRGLRGERTSWDAPTSAGVAALAHANERPDGVKIRLGQHAGRDDVADVRIAQSAARDLGVPLVVHVSGSRADPDVLFDLMRERDIVTHVYCPPPFSVLDGGGSVRRSAREARERGVRFDLGRSTHRHFSADVARRAIASGFAPDFLSSDLISYEWSQTHDHELHAILPEFVELGMRAEDVLAAATAKPAAFYRLPLPDPTGDAYVEFDDRLRLLAVCRDGARTLPDRNSRPVR